VVVVCGGTVVVGAVVVVGTVVVADVLVAGSVVVVLPADAAEVSPVGAGSAARS